MPTTITVVASAAAGAVVGGLLARVDERRRRRTVVGTTVPTTHTRHPALRYGLPQTHTIVETPSFVASGDYRTRNASFVIEHLTLDTIRGGAAHRGNQFHEEKQIAPRLRSRLQDYKNSGYDRGHLAPAADHQESQEAMDSTFSLVNMSPQDPGFNRDAWAAVERWLRERVSKGEATSLTVMTGPLFLPTTEATESDGQGYTMKYNLIGKSPCLVHVPTHFFKAVVAELPDGTQAIGAVALPNERIPKNTPLSSFIVPLAALEAASGVLTFPDLLDERKRGLVMAAEKRAMKQLTTAPLLPAPPSATPPKATKGQPPEIAHLCERFDCREAQRALARSEPKRPPHGSVGRRAEQRNT